MSLAVSYQADFYQKMHEFYKFASGYVPSCLAALAYQAALHVQSDKLLSPKCADVDSK